jgi:peptide/nickel transport system substrate-binding protein
MLLVAVLIAIGAVQMTLYSQSYRHEAPVAGGTYVEGVIGPINNFNPLYAETDNERAVSSLVYSGLFKYDKSGSLAGELAKRWTVLDDGAKYEITLHDNVLWQDGQPLTADDVVFTVNLLKNPASGSALSSSWRGVEAEKISDYKLRLSLSRPYAPFLAALTFGILPKHVLAETSPGTLRDFVANNRIVGSGPYVFRSNQASENGQNRMLLTANSQYFKGPAGIKNFQVRSYDSSAALASAWRAGEINGAAGLSINDIRSVAAGNLVEAPLSDGVYALFNLTTPAIGDKAVRQALRLGLDLGQLKRDVTESDQLTLGDLNGPVLPGIYQAVDELKQPTGDRAAAASRLDEAGWRLDASGYRQKDGQPLSLNMVTVSGTDYERAASSLAEQWRQLGVKIELTIADPSSVQQNYFIPRAYDVLVYQLHLAFDPDVYAYWHSSQNTASGLNFTGYSSLLSDASLSSGRTRTSVELRQAKYRTFVETWLDDAPAVALYRPNYYYVRADRVHSLTDRPLVSGASRFYDVNDWTARVDEVNTTP